MTENPRPYDVVRDGSSSPTKRTEAKLRIDGQTKQDIHAIVQRLRQVADVIEESRDYPNKGGSGIRRYLTIRV